MVCCPGSTLVWSPSPRAGRVERRLSCFLLEKEFESTMQMSVRIEAQCFLGSSIPVAAKFQVRVNLEAGDCRTTYIHCLSVGLGRISRMACIQAEGTPGSHSETVALNRAALAC